MLYICLSTSLSPDFLDGSLSSVGSSSDSPAKMEGVSPSSSNSPLTPLQDLSPKWSQTSEEDWGCFSGPHPLIFTFFSNAFPTWLLFSSQIVLLHLKKSGPGVFSVWDRP